MLAHDCLIVRVLSLYVDTDIKRNCTGIKPALFPPSVFVVLWNKPNTSYSSKRWFLQAQFGETNFVHEYLAHTLTDRHTWSTWSCLLFSRTVARRESYCRAWSVLKLRSLSKESFSLSRRCNIRQTYHIFNSNNHILHDRWHAFFFASGFRLVITLGLLLESEKTHICIFDSLSV